MANSEKKTVVGVHLHDAKNVSQNDSDVDDPLSCMRKPEGRNHAQSVRRALKLDLALPSLLSEGLVRRRLALANPRRDPLLERRRGDVVGRRLAIGLRLLEELPKNLKPLRLPEPSDRKRGERVPLVRSEKGGQVKDWLVFVVRRKASLNTVPGATVLRIFGHKTDEVFQTLGI